MRDRNSGPENNKRLRRRRKLLWWSVVPVLLVLLTTAKIFSLGVLGNSAAEGFKRGDTAAVGSAASALAIANIFEPHKALFAAGDALVLEEDYAGARVRFEEALAAAPESDDCKIRVNLVLTIEALGDSAQASGDSSEAAGLYAEGLAAIKEAPAECFPESRSAQGNEGEKLNRADARLKQKSGQGSQQQSEQNHGADGQPKPSNEARQSQLQKLEQSGKNSQQERNTGRQRDEYLDSDGAGTDRPW